MCSGNISFDEQEQVLERTWGPCMLGPGVHYKPLKGVGVSMDWLAATTAGRAGS